MKNEDFKLKVFTTLVRLGSFTKAAAELGVSQPAVSQNIAELERIYGLKLISRDKSGVGLTEDGQAFMPYARNILAAYEAAASFAGQRSSGEGAISPEQDTRNAGKPAAALVLSGMIPGIRLLDADLADKLGEILDSQEMTDPRL